MILFRFQQFYVFETGDEGNDKVFPHLKSWLQRSVPQSAGVVFVDKRKQDCKMILPVRIGSRVGTDVDRFTAKARKKLKEKGRHVVIKQLYRKYLILFPEADEHCSQELTI